MSVNVLQQATDYHKIRKRKRTRRRIFSVFAAIVVFCTTYALILPAITQDQPVYCGLEEHTHTDSCLDDTAAVICTLQEHIHNDTCFVDPTVKQSADNVMSAIDTLPFVADVEATLAELEAKKDYSGYEAYYQQIARQSREVYEYYNAISEDAKLLVTNEDKLMALEYIWGDIVLTPQTAADRIDAFTNGSLTFRYNYTKDAFVNDAAYASFFNKESPLGTAGSFHIVAFDTAHLYVHTNGNVLAKNVIANSNFGTNSKGDKSIVELSYIQQYLVVNANSAADTNDYLVIGSDNTVGLTDNGNALSIDNTKMDKPKTIIQDDNTATAPFIDLARVEQEIRSISSTLAGYEASDTSLLEVVTTGDNPALTLTHKDNIAVFNLTAAELKTITNHGRGLAMKGFESDGNGVIIVNVDCADWDATQTLVLPNSGVWVDGVEQSLTETLDFTAGRVVWNFVNADGLKIETAMMLGMIIAPESDLDLNKSFNGTAIGKNVENHSETHRTDFTGEILVPTGTVTAPEMTVLKVDADDTDVVLSGASFTLYAWNGTAWSTAASGVTADDGRFLFADLAYNTAYKLEETAAPDGYLLSSSPHYFFFPHDNVIDYPVCQPTDFVGSQVSSGYICTVTNEISVVETTSLTVSKTWVASDGSALPDEPQNAVRFEVWQAPCYLVGTTAGTPIYGDPADAVLYGTYEIAVADGWTRTVAGLPLTNADATIRYVYTVKEIVPDGCQSSVTDDGSGHITICNTVTVDKQYTPLIIRKTWSEIPDNIDAITLELWRVERTDVNGTFGGDTLVDTVTVTAANGWVWQAPSQTLLSQQTIGTVTTYYAYYIVENVPDGYHPDYGTTPTTDEITLHNIAVETTDITITKVWRDENGNDLTTLPADAVTIQLLRSSDNGVTWECYGDPIRVSAFDNWTTTVRGLPKTDPVNRLTFLYSAQEVTINGFLSEVTIGTDGNITVTNSDLGNTTYIEVQKLWFKGDTQIIPSSGEVTVQLYQQPDSGGSAESVPIDIFIDQWYQAGTGAVYKNTVDVPLGSTFTFVIYSSNATPTLGYGNVTSAWSMTTLSPISSEAVSGGYKVTYEYTVTEEVDLLGYVGVNDTASCRFEAITASIVPEATLFDSVVLTASDRWKHTFKGLPLYEYDDNGNITTTYSYFVKELDGELYDVVYTDLNGNTIGAEAPVSGHTILVKNTVSDDAYTLPETGGSGTTPFIALGAALMIGAVGAAYILHKRQKRGIADSSL